MHAAIRLATTLGHYFSGQNGFVRPVIQPIGGPVGGKSTRSRARIRMPHSRRYRPFGSDLEIGCSRSFAMPH